MKYKKLILPFILFLSSLSSISQDWQEVFRPNSTGNVSISDSYFYEEGNKYFVTGYFTNSLFLAVGDTLQCEGVTSTFIASFDDKLNPLWVYEIDGSGHEFRSKMNLDAAGNVYVTGMFTGGAIFGDDTLSSDGIGDIYITKLSKNGQLNWVKHIGRGESFQTHGRIMIDDNNDILPSFNH